MNKINRQNRNRLIDTENSPIVVRGERLGGLGEKGEEIKKKTHRHRQQRGEYQRKRGWGR